MPDKSFNFYFLCYVLIGRFPWLAVPLRLENFHLPPNRSSRRSSSHCQPERPTRVDAEHMNFMSFGAAVRVWPWMIGSKPKLSSAQDKKIWPRKIHEGKCQR